MNIGHSMNIIDLRSDTVTRPTPEMRAAMARAEVGDDVYGEDPTINRLQELAAQMVGKQAGLFVPSGTMGNLNAVLTHCTRGDEIILGHLSHIFYFEAGGVSALGGVHSRQVTNQPDGTLELAAIEAAIRSDDDHFPTTRLVALENTHNRCGGVALGVGYTRAVGEIAHAHGLALHLDGARLFNAAAALCVPASQLAEPADSVTFCLSKGLCAPVGSVLCGSQAFIHRARRIRKQLGGGMRQAGILAAAGIVALETMVDRLPEDHQRARQLAQGLQKIPGVRIEPGSPYTNMVFVSLGEDLPVTAPQLAERLLAQNIKVSSIGERRFRLVTHYWIDQSAVDRFVKAFGETIEASNLELITGITQEPK
jgi:threonine aldolase